MNSYPCALTLSTNECTQPQYIARHNTLHTLPGRNLPGITYIEAEDCKHTADKI